MPHFEDGDYLRRLRDPTTQREERGDNPSLFAPGMRLQRAADALHGARCLADARGEGGTGVALGAKSRLHYTLFITTLIIWNKTRASTIWTLTFIVGAFVNNAFSFTLWTAFHS